MNNTRHFFKKGRLVGILLLGIISVAPSISFAQPVPSQIDSGGSGGGSSGGRESDVEAKPAEPYKPLAPLPGLSDQELNAGGEPIGNYFSTMYKIGVSLVLLIAVVMLMYGGIRYMTSDSIGGKGGAREAITKAIIGILLALGSYALLYLIGGPGSVSVSLDFPKVGYEAPPPPAQSTPSTPPEGADYYCEASFKVTEVNSIIGGNPENLPSCPISFMEKVMKGFASEIPLGEIILDTKAKITQEELVDYFENGGFNLSGKCAYTMGPKKVIVEINMGQCKARADREELLKPGTVDSCFTSTRSTGTLKEKKFFCENPYNPPPKEIIFKLPPGNIAGYHDPGACFQVDTDDVTRHAKTECEAAGGTLTSYAAAEAYGLFCTKPETPGYCEKIKESAFPLIDDLNASDKDWDKLYCDSRNLPEGMDQDHKDEFAEVYMRLSEITGGQSQASGYYTDQAYCDGPGNGRCHAGIDMSAIGVTDLKAPQAGKIKILRDESMNCYNGNAKIAVIVPGGPTWVYTHVHIANGIGDGQVVSAGSVIAHPSANPGYYDINTKQCATFPEHLHLEVWNDETCFNHPTNDPFYWTDSKNGSNNGCPHSGFVTDTEAIAAKTMCPLQAVYEGIEKGTIPADPD